MNLQYRIVTRDRLLEILIDTATHRDERPEMIQGVGPAWILHERNRMLDAVNEERQRLGKKPIQIDVIERSEQQASGHSDYASKFALYCTELVESP